MDTTLYEDNSSHGGLGRAQAMMMKLKSGMTLHFASQQPISVATKTEKLDGVLSSSDVGLPSPELERFLFHQPEEVPATSTPTTQILFPKSVTEEQEAYARGFIDALEELHKRQGPPVQAVLQPMAAPEYGECDTVNTYASMASRAGSNPPSFTRATVHHTGNQFNSSNHRPAGNNLYTWANNQSTRDSRVHANNSPYHIVTPIHYNHAAEQQQQPAPPPAHFKEEPQTVPCLGGTPPLSPINMDDQERVKLERKRARNRMAARKCRTRKLEQIAHLEVRVRGLKDRNSSLAQTAARIREDVTRLRQQIAGHVENGCQLTIQCPTPGSQFGL